jgi:hypothetical protein
MISDMFALVCYVQSGIWRENAKITIHFDLELYKASLHYIRQGSRCFVGLVFSPPIPVSGKSSTTHHSTIYPHVKMDTIFFGENSLFPFVLVSFQRG